MKKAVSRGLLMAAVICGSMGMVWEAYAADEKLSSYNLEQIVVTATRTEKQILEVPANTIVISAKEIKEGDYATVFEAVRNLAQANASQYDEDGGDWSSSGMSSRIKLRGMDSGTLILVNGAPSNFMNFGTLNSIPMDQIEKIEIVKGSGSVLYGPQAMGGVINIITKEPGKNQKTGGNIFGTIGNRFKEAGVNVESKIINIGARKSFTKDRFGVQRLGNTGSGTSINIKDKKKNQLYLNAQLAKNLTFNYGRTENESSYEVKNCTHYVIDKHYESHGKHTFDNYGLFYNNPESKLMVSVGYNKMDYDTVYNKNLPFKYFDNHFYGDNTEVNIQKTFDLRNDKDSLTIGANYNKEKMNFVYNGNPGGNSRKSYSLYQSYDHKVTDKFNLILGLREYWVAKSNYQDRDFQVLPQIQGNYRINKNSSYYFNSGKSFENPQISAGFNYFGMTLFEPNPDLKPQSSWSHEIGYKYDDEDKTFTADIFYMNVKDKFASGKAASGASITINKDKWRNMGLEVNYKQKINRNLSANIGFTLQNPESQLKGQDWQQDEAKFILNLGSQYNKGKFSADARIFSYLGRQNAYYKYDGSRANNNADHKIGNSCDFTLSLAYRPTDMDTIKVTGRNLFDRDDAFNNDEYRSTPIHYTITYERKF